MFSHELTDKQVNCLITGMIGMDYKNVQLNI